MTNEGVQDKDYWKLRIKGTISYPRLTWKMAVKMPCVRWPLYFSELLGIVGAELSTGGRMPSMLWIKQHIKALIVLNIHKICKLSTLSALFRRLTVYKTATIFRNHNFKQIHMMIQNSKTATHTWAKSLMSQSTNNQYSDWLVVIQTCGTCISVNCHAVVSSITKLLFHHLYTENHT